MGEDVHLEEPAAVLPRREGPGRRVAAVLEQHDREPHVARDAVPRRDRGHDALDRPDVRGRALGRGGARSEDGRAARPRAAGAGRRGRRREAAARGRGPPRPAAARRAPRLRPRGTARRGPPASNAATGTPCASARTGTHPAAPSSLTVSVTSSRSGGAAGRRCRKPTPRGPAAAGPFGIAARAPGPCGGAARPVAACLAGACPTAATGPWGAALPVRPVAPSVTAAAVTAARTARASLRHRSARHRTLQRYRPRKRSGARRRTTAPARSDLVIFRHAWS